MEAGNPETHTRVSLGREDAVCVKAEDARAAAASAARTRRALGTLLRIGTAIHATLGVEGLALRLLELIGEVVPAERGAILLFERGGEEPAAAFGWHRATGPGGPVAVSSQTMERARREDVAILTRDLVGGEPRSLLVAPLCSERHGLG